MDSEMLQPIFLLIFPKNKNIVKTILDFLLTEYKFHTTNNNKLLLNNNQLQIKIHFELN